MSASTQQNNLVRESCNKCNSDELNAGEFNSNGQSVHRMVTCEDCNNQWVEIFEFSKNEEI